MVGWLVVGFQVRVAFLRRGREEDLRGVARAAVRDPDRSPLFFLHFRDLFLSESSVWESFVFGSPFVRAHELSPSVSPLLCSSPSLED